MTEDRTKRFARYALITATMAIALSYAAAFSPGGAPEWAAWFPALGIPVALGGIIVLGAAREGGGVGRLRGPIAFVILLLTLGFCAALALPPDDGPATTLWLGLPPRAAIIIYGIGLLPIIILPIAYALTFETQTLNETDLARVRELGAQFAAEQARQDAERAQ